MKIQAIKTRRGRMLPIHYATFYACGTIEVSDYGSNFVLFPGDYEIVEVDAQTKSLTYEEHLTYEEAMLGREYEKANADLLEVVTRVFELNDKAKEIFGKEEGQKLLEGPRHVLVYKLEKRGIKCAETYAEADVKFKRYNDLMDLHTEAQSVLEDL
jgi:hypothetical protein